MNNKKKKELSKFQKTLAIIGLILCAAGAIFGFSQSMRMSVFFPPMNTAVRYILSTLFVTYFFAGFYFRPDQKFSELPLPAKILWLPGFIIFLMVLIGLLATVLYDRAILPTSNEVPYAILSGVIVFVIGMVYLSIKRRPHMSSKVRQLSKEEILPEDLNIAAVTINRTIEFYSAPEFYGKARAYFFTNFVIITFGLLICTVRSFLFEDIENTLGFIIMTLLPAFISYLIWRPVSKKAHFKEYRLITAGMIAQGFLIMVKMMMILSLLLIPLANHVVTLDRYEYMYVTKGKHKGEWVLMRLKMNGQWQDIYGNKYTDLDV